MENNTELKLEKKVFCFSYCEGLPLGIYKRVHNVYIFSYDLNKANEIFQSMIKKFSLLTKEMLLGVIQIPEDKLEYIRICRRDHKYNYQTLKYFLNHHTNEKFICKRIEFKDDFMVADKFLVYEKRDDFSKIQICPHTCPIVSKPGRNIKIGSMVCTECDYLIESNFKTENPYVICEKLNLHLKQIELNKFRGITGDQIIFSK